MAAGDDVEAQAEAILLLEGEDSADPAKILAKILTAQEIPFLIEDAVLEVMVELKSPEAVRRLAKEVHTHPRWQARIIIARGLKEISSPLALEGLHKGLDHPRWAVRSAIVGAIGSTRSADSIEPLIDRLKKEDGRVAGEIHWALRKITGKDLVHLEEWETWWESAKDDFVVRPLDRKKPRGPLSPGNTVTKSIYGKVVSKKVIFVVDVSESMKVVPIKGPDRGLSRLQIMKRELCRTILWALPERAEFNIIAYSSEVRVWKKKMVVADQKMRDEACVWVERLEHGGETNIMGALDVAMGEKRVDTIYFLSDGTPSMGRTKEVREILAEVRKVNGPRSVVINTIALLGGDGTRFKITEAKPLARNFLKELAAKNGGTFTSFE